MDDKVRLAKSQEIKDVLRLRFLESATYKEITGQVGVSRPTARKYADKFVEIVSDEDFAIKDTYKDCKRKVPFPVQWKKYVKIMVDTHIRHIERVATPAMRKKIIQTATANLPPDIIRSATSTYKIMRESEKRVPSYETIAKIIREYRNKETPPTNDDTQ